MSRRWSLAGSLLLVGCPKAAPPRALSLELPATITSRDPVVVHARATRDDGSRESLRGDLPFAVKPPDLASIGKQGALTCTRSGEGTVSLTVEGVTGTAKLDCKLAASLQVVDELQLDMVQGALDPQIQVLDAAGKALELPVSLSSDKGSVVQARGGLLVPIAVGTAELTVRAGQVVKKVEVQVVRTVKPEAVPVDQNRRIYYSLDAGKYRLAMVLPSPQRVSFEWLGAPYCAYKGEGLRHASNCTLQSKGGVSFDNPAFLVAGQKTPSTEGVTLLEVP